MGDWTIRMDNTPFGGDVQYDIPWFDFPGYPWEESTELRREIRRSLTGKVFSHELWRKRHWRLHFRAVSPDCAATFKRIAESNLPFLFLWTFDDVTGTATCVFTERSFLPPEKMKDLFDFDFKFEEWNE